MSGLYFNENDPFAARWLKNLWPDAVVDDRSIADVRPDDVRGFRRCHFFAGIGGWELALALAGWPDDRPVWTGSCPCQPFSNAGKRAGTKDARHLWPELRRLVAECRPPGCLGEQTQSKSGRAWLAGVRADLEALGYAVGSADLCAAGTGAPQIRQRLYWVADAGCEGLPGRQEQPARQECPAAERGGDAGWVELAASDGRLEGRPEPVWGRFTSRREHGFWSDFDLLPCRDGKVRRIEPGVEPLASGISGRVGLLRGYGNAIVPEVAAVFIKAFMESQNGQEA